jgi:hypothetical protein
MIIHIPEVMTRAGEVVLTARVECEASGLPMPDRLWFAYPEEFADFVTEGSDGFALGLLLLAMRLGEDLEIRGRLCSQLAHGLEEYQRWFHFWKPRTFKRVSLQTRTLANGAGHPGTGVVGTAFSGGVDSFYTLRMQLPDAERNPAYAVTHALFVHGFDVPLSDERTFAVLRQQYGPTLARLGVKGIFARTNIRELTDPVSWIYSHGSALAGSALNLSHRLRVFFIPSSHVYSDTYLWGSDFKIDHLMSSRALQISHHAGDIGRLAKTLAIADWEHAQRGLRVCWEKPDGLDNCCECEKCIRTMLMLDLAGCLPKYQTFPRKLERTRVRSLSVPEANEGFFREIVAEARRRHRPEVVSDLQWMFTAARLRKVVQVTRRWGGTCYRKLVPREDVSWEAN